VIFILVSYSATIFKFEMCIIFKIDQRTIPVIVTCFSAGGLQQDGSFTGESKQNVDADISEDIRYLVTELIDELVADAEDSSVAEFVQQNEACIESDVQESIQQSADVDEEAAMLADLR